MLSQHRLLLPLLTNHQITGLIWDVTPVTRTSLLLGNLSWLYPQETDLSIGTQWLYATPVNYLQCQTSIIRPLLTHLCPQVQILSFKSISSSPIFRHFNQVNFSRQYILNRKDGVGLLYSVDSYSDEIWDGVVVVEQHGIQIGWYQHFSWIGAD